MPNLIDPSLATVSGVPTSMFTSSRTLDRLDFSNQQQTCQPPGQEMLKKQYSKCDSNAIYMILYTKWLWSKWGIDWQLIPSERDPRNVNASGVWFDDLNHFGNTKKNSSQLSIVSNVNHQNSSGCLIFFQLQSNQS